MGVGGAFGLNGVMSDIGAFPGLDRAAFFLYVLLIVAPPVAIALLCLLARAFRPKWGAALLAIYFVASVAIEFALMCRWANFADPSSLGDALPIALASSAGTFVLFLAGWWAVRFLR